VWGATFSCCDCTLQYIRRTDDHWNNISAGFLTGGILAARAGWKSAGKSAVIGGIILGVIEGVAALMQRGSAQTPRQQALEALQQERAAAEDMKRRKEMGVDEVRRFTSFINFVQLSFKLFQLKYSKIRIKRAGSQDRSN